MISNFTSSYRKNNGNIYEPNVFNYNLNKNNKNNYINLRYSEQNDFMKDEYSKFNDKKALTNRKYSTIFLKKDNFNIQKDRFQKFYLNNSAPSINLIDSDKKILKPIPLSYRNNDTKKNLKKIFANQIQNDINNYEKEEKNNNNENNLILSQNDIYNNPDYKHMNILNKYVIFPKHHCIFNKFNGKKRTDITNQELYDKVVPGYNKDYIDYIFKNKEVDLYNKRLIENKNNKIISEKNKLILKERNQIKEANDYYKRICLKNALYNKKKIKYYKNELDNQMEHFLENKLVNENLPYSQFLKNKDYNRLKSPIMQYLNKNDYFDVNPFNNKSVTLGKSNLKYDTIMKPKIQFKINKYIFPEIGNNIY